jgi:hypothetical protein
MTNNNAPPQLLYYTLFFTYVGYYTTLKHHQLHIIMNDSIGTCNCLWQGGTTVRCPGVAHTPSGNNECTWFGHIPTLL